MSSPKGRTERRRSHRRSRHKRSNSSGKHHYVGDYLLTEQIGDGMTSLVHRAINRKTKQIVAIKTINKRTLSPDILARVYQEIQILEELDHGNIVKLFDVIDGRKALHLIMEYCHGGEVFKVVNTHGPMPEDFAREIMKQTVNALNYVHSKGIAHRDLKLENLLMDESYNNVKLSDFGFGAYTTTESGEANQLSAAVGTLYYCSPEVIHNDGGYSGLPVDVWSLGVCFFAMVCGYFPFDGETVDEILVQMQQLNYKVPDTLSAGAADLIARMFTVDPAQRITMAEIANHPWLAIEPYRRKRRRKKRRRRRSRDSPPTRGGPADPADPSSAIPISPSTSRRRSLASASGGSPSSNPHSGSLPSPGSSPASGSPFAHNSSLGTPLSPSSDQGDDLEVNEWGLPLPGYMRERAQSMGKLTDLIQAVEYADLSTSDEELLDTRSWTESEVDDDSDGGRHHRHHHHHHQVTSSGSWSSSSFISVSSSSSLRPGEHHHKRYHHHKHHHKTGSWSSSSWVSYDDDEEGAHQHHHHHHHHHRSEAQQQQKQEKQQRQQPQQKQPQQKQQQRQPDSPAHSPLAAGAAPTTATATTTVSAMPPPAQRDQALAVPPHHPADASSSSARSITISPLTSDTDLSLSLSED